MEEDLHPYDSCLDWFNNQIKNINIPSIDMVRTFLEFESKNFNNYCAIFIGGGNTFKLLKGIKDYNIYEKIINYLNDDGIIVGGSAGAIIFGYDINSCLVMDRNYVKLDDTKGFNFLNGKSIFAHYTNSKTIDIHKKYTDYLLDYSSKYEDVIALPEEDTIYIDDDNIEIIGYKPYYEFSNGNINKIDIIKLVPYSDNDYEFVYDIKKNAYKKYVVECWGSWNDDDQRKYYDTFINSVKENAFIIMNGNEKIGFYNGEVLENNSYEIGNICIIPKYQGNGIGTMILNNIIEKYKDKNIEIQYFKNNPVGALYERLGFVLNGETEFHYQMIKKR